MKRFFITFVSLLVIAVSVCAQAPTVSRETREFVKKYKWGMGAVTKAKLTSSDGTYGMVHITVLANKGVEVANSTSIHVAVKFNMYGSQQRPATLEDTDDCDCDKYSTPLIPPGGTWRSPWVYDCLDAMRYSQAAEVQVINWKK